LPPLWTAAQKSPPFATGQVQGEKRRTSFAASQARTFQTGRLCLFTHSTVATGGRLNRETACASGGCADLERARLLHHYALHRASADAQRLADLRYARAALVEAPALFICASLAVLLVGA
jgi:hypothetical protein